MLFWTSSLCFLTSLDSTLILPTLYQYVKDLGGDENIYWSCIALYYISKAISVAFLGWLMDWRSYKHILASSAFLIILGNILYCQAPWTSSTTAIPVIILSRILAGFGSSNTFISYSHITRYFSFKRNI